MTPKKPDQSLRSKYDFRGEVLDIIIGGKSSLDSSTAFQVQSLEEADLFIQNYGYDLEDPIEQAEVLGYFHEALNFIRKNFLKPENPDGLRLDIPRKILELTDVRELFLMIDSSAVAPNPQSKDPMTLILRSWACSLLKIMHTISHIDKDLRSPYFTDIQKQIFDRFYKYIHRDADSKLFLGEKMDDPLKIGLVAFETKPKKSRDSIILKLLHKSENVAEDIFDRVGIRFITFTPFGALRVVKYLKDKMIIMTPNIKPSRSRNTLIQIDAFRAQLADLLGRVENNSITEEEMISKLEAVALTPQFKVDNPHSSQFYRSMQFTGRHLIKLKNPLYDSLKELKNSAKSPPVNPTVETVNRIIDKLELKHIQREIRFFYPFEVQVVDQKSAEENERGRSAHSEYKRAQVLTAMKRVMGSLMDAGR